MLGLQQKNLIKVTSDVIVLLMKCNLPVDFINVLLGYHSACVICYSFILVRWCILCSYPVYDITEMLQLCYNFLRSNHVSSFQHRCFQTQGQ